MQHAMKKTALMVALLAAGATVQAEWSANVAMTTDYVWRGSSQSDDSAAIQGGIDYAHESGFYVGTWASNVDWDDENTTAAATSDGASVEWDIYGGVSGEFSNGLGWDVGIIHYMYPDVSSGFDYDWTEVYGGLSYAFNDTVSASASIAHSSEALGTTTDGTYLNVGVEIALPQGFGLNASIGSYNFDDENVLADYTDYKIGVTKSFGKFDFELAYTDTDDWFVSGVDGEEYSDGRAWLMVSTSF